MLDITTDRTRFTASARKLPANFDFSTTSIAEGEWVELAAGGRVAKSSAAAINTSHNTFPVGTHTDRADVKSALVVEVPVGIFEAVTDNYDSSATINVGTLLTVEHNSGAGRLTAAASGNAVRAICTDTDATAGTITFRMMDGGHTLA